MSNTSSKKKIAIFHTGGTFAMNTDEAGTTKLQDNNKFQNLLHSRMEPFEVKHKEDFELTQLTIFNMPSVYIGGEELIVLRKAILDNLHDMDGIVITHGTDTLEETAYFLDITIPHTIPVVLTGAMRPIKDEGSDAIKNLHGAILTAASDEAKNMGTMVHMNEEIHAARSVVKTHTTNLSAFRSPEFGKIGKLYANGRIDFTRKLPPSDVYDIDKLTKNVALIEIFSGMNDTLFASFDAYEQTVGHYPFDGIVIEGAGLGHLTSNIVPSLVKLEGKGIPIVLASRCLSGSAQPVYGYYGGAKSLKEEFVKSIIFAGNLNGLKARIKLAVLLEKGLSIREIEEEFDQF